MPWVWWLDVLRAAGGSDFNRVRFMAHACKCSSVCIKRYLAGAVMGPPSIGVLSPDMDCPRRVGEQTASFEHVSRARYSRYYTPSLWSDTPARTHRALPVGPSV
jgi:hypothetical protein